MNDQVWQAEKQRRKQLFRELQFRSLDGLFFLELETYDCNSFHATPATARAV